MTILAMQSPPTSGHSLVKDKPCLPSLWLKWTHRFLVFLSWRTFTLSLPLPQGIWLLRRLRPPARTLAFSRPVSRLSGLGVPQFQCKRRIERPLATCCAPGILGTTHQHRRNADAQPHAFWLRYISHFYLLSFTTLYHRFLFVRIGLRSGRSAPLWLGAAELLSLGFPPQRMPSADAGQVDLTPLFTCNPLNGQSFCTVKGRTRPEGRGFLHPIPDHDH